MKVDKRKKIHRFSVSNFIERACNLHNNKYDYSLVAATKMSDKVTIVCPVHGEFRQEAGSHINKGYGCRACSREESIKIKFNNEWFINKAITIHGHKYDYSEIDYKKGTDILSITCPIHGSFQQEARVHLCGCGCQECAYEGNNYWSYSGWEVAGKLSNNFDGFKLYIIKVFDEKEEFYKIGKTYMQLKTRFSKGQLPYLFDIIAIVNSCAKEICKLESHLQFINKNNIYTPIKHFAGKGECFSSIDTVIKELHASR
jgi:hypothetical protein